MKILIWNCRGSGNARFHRNIKEMCRSHGCDVLCIVETRASPEQTICLPKRLGFSNDYKVDSIGFLGRLWAMWKEESIDLQIVYSTHQVIHAVIKGDQGDWLLSMVYASPTPSLREFFWESMASFSRQFSMSWLFAGDMNDYVSPSERYSTTSTSITHCLRFQTDIDHCDLFYLGTSGPRFTWSNGRTHERLDRALANISWKHIFLEASVRVLPRTHSDHHPILINTSALPMPLSYNRPFRFQAAWLSHSNFIEVFRDTWERNHDSISQVVQDLAATFKVWNYEIFSNIFKMKRRLLARLNGIQRSPVYNHSTSLHVLEKDLIWEYNHVLKQEEILWAQKSIVKWLQEGDLNIRFFHMSTLIRRSRNKVDTLKINGEWCTNREVIKQHVCNHFINLFQSEDEALEAADSSNSIFPSLNPDEAVRLANEVQIDEMKNALLSMHR